VIGEVTDTGRVVILDNGQVVADIPAKSLADECPTYNLDAEKPAYIEENKTRDLSFVEEPSDYNDVLLRLLATPSIASKRYVFEQYDHMVQTQTTAFPGRTDAAVLRIRGTNKAIALTTDCNARYCFVDPYAGAQIAVAEAARNLSCVGATPLAVTDCLNFPNPEKPDNFWVFRTSVEGLAEACEQFDTPVISGNVSFYNETPDHAIYPTPTIGMIGLIEDACKNVGSGFVSEGDDIFVLTNGNPSWGASEYLALMHGVEAGAPPTLNMAGEKAVQAAIRKGIREGMILSAHDAAEGGIGVALAECSIASGLGASIELPSHHELRMPSSGVSDRSAALELFGERTATVLVTASPSQRQAVRSLAAGEGVSLIRLGSVGGENFIVTHDSVPLIFLPVSAMRNVYESAIPKALHGK
jgi:phosphoribosylformylglycinamidine synthase